MTATRFAPGHAGDDGNLRRSFVLRRHVGAHDPEVAARLLDAEAVREPALDLGQGDLLVMGGTSQRTWQHSVPKTAKPVGPRISITFRHAVL